MRYWTLQPAPLLREALDTGIYQPDFSKSIYLHGNPDLEILYNKLLAAYNWNNCDNRPGLIFAFEHSDNSSGIYCFEDFEEFYGRVQRSRAALRSLWKHLIQRPDMRIVELEYDDTWQFNPIPIDLNDFQFLMPPLTMVPPYRKEDISRLMSNMINGTPAPSTYPSYLVQAHLPCIMRENIRNVYEPFDLLPGDPPVVF